MKVAVIIATYVRKNGLSKQHLDRCLTSLKNQTNQNFKIFLIGDAYENEEELFSFSDWFDKDHLKIVNLEEAYERSRWKGYELWCVSPVTPMNKGIDIALSEGFDYMCFIDDDDYYLPDHIETILQAIKDTGKNLIHTVCKVVRGGEPFNFPELQEQLYQLVTPRCEQFAKCSTCVNFKNIELRPRNVFEEIGVHLVYDCDLWERIGNSGEVGVKVNKVTVVNDDEKNIVRTEI
jgi:glycosyltransferase involved in cell wall biosynthesis